jgi:hypothetical protein
MFKNVKVGDIVTRNLCGIKMKMYVTAVDDKLITAGMGWTFSRETGAEIDPELGWDERETGSFLMQVEGEANG